MLEDYFLIQIFFIIFRETLETAIIVSVLLAFIHQRFATEAKQDTDDAPKLAHEHNEKRKLQLQVWVGAVLGLVVCFLIGVVFVMTFFILGKDYWAYTERVWEGVFSLLSSVIITIMGVGLLRINKVMKVKWLKKLGDAYDGRADAPQTEGGVQNADASAASTDALIASPTIIGNDVSPTVTSAATSASNTLSSGKAPRLSFGKKYFLAILPFVTTLREGLEAVVFIGGIGMTSPPSALPLSILGGIAFGAILGYALYKGGNHLSLQYFLIFLTCFLYLVSAGLMLRGVWFLELEQFVRACGGLDVSETGSGPGLYDIAKSVWHVNCCNGLTDGWWMVFNAIFGWTNSATYGSVGLYCAYWIVVISWLEVRLYEEREGVLPLVPIKWQLKRIRKRLQLYEARLAASDSRQLYERISQDREGPEEARALLGEN
jgi:high-affinity iron transporter